MITDLIIRNFAIIENLHVRFGDGFNVLTGETGAGKSIIIDAVNLLLGGRARSEVIRTGSDEASVEAIFELEGEDRQRLKLAEMELDDGAELLVRRLISRSGKNRVFVNGALLPLGQLRELTSQLVNIYGQHEHQNLQRVETHLDLLDRFAELQQPLEDYRLSYANLQNLQQRLVALDMAERERQQRLDLIGFQSRELADARLEAGEEEELNQERSRLLHGEKLIAASSGGYDRLYGEPQAVCEQLGAVADQLEQLQQIDPQLANLAEALRGALYTIEDAALQLRDYAEGLEFEPERQQQVEERLALLARLKRKYASSVEELLKLQKQLETELDQLSDVEGHRHELQRQLEQAEHRTGQLGGQLSAARQQAAKKLATAVESELSELAMEKARFSLVLTPLSEPGPDGLERGEFFLAANPGEAAQPLARIASGGELSRIMLALKRSAPEGDGVRTLIFDEVDAGIGGAAATAVGEKICRLGRNFQVLCVTHLPQVAAFADRHYQVQKQESAGRTQTRLELLEGDTRVAEMARMLGGSRISERTLEHARDLLTASRLQPA